ncbi:MAG TPA: acylphosphatase [Cyclobacteriaceae bacterium]
MIHRNIRVGGKVQGVFYRASTADKAKELGLRGFVLNEPAGSVYMEIEGEESKVNEMIEWARKGPPRAGVTSCDVTEGPVVSFKTFEIRR